MAWKVASSKLNTPSARSKIKVTKSGEWVVLQKGCALGYRKGPKGGRWVARFIQPGYREEARIAEADDRNDADGKNVLTYDQAQEGARKWFEAARGRALRQGTDAHHTDARDAVPVTVADAAKAYLIDYEAGKTKGGGKGRAQTKSTINTVIIPALGTKKIASLTKRTIEVWRDRIKDAPPRVRVAKGEEAKFREGDDTADAPRRRRATANRNLNVLKAILNHAHQNHRVGNKDEWALVKPFGEVNAPKIRHLSDAESRRLVNAAAVDMRQMIVAALLTGARYSELAALRVSDYTPDAGTIFIANSKSGQARHIALTDEGVKFFKGAVLGKSRMDKIFTRKGGAFWKSSDQQRPMLAACKAAKIAPAIGFHILRHTYGSRLAMNGVALNVIAKQLGHADTRMTERHYAHLAPDYIKTTVRAAFGNLGIVRGGNVVSLESSRKAAKRVNRRAVLR